MKHVSEDKLQVYVETLGLQQFQQDVRPQRLAICLSLLRGLAQAMALPNPPNTVWAVLCTTIEKIFNVLPNHIQAGKSSFFRQVHLSVILLSQSHDKKLAVCARLVITKHY